MRRHLLIVVPAAATVLVAVVLLGPGQLRAVSAARVFSAGEELRAVRVVTITRDDGREEPLVVPQLSVFVDNEPAPRWAGAGGPGGVTEVVLDPPAPSGAELHVVAGREVLARGKATSSDEPAALQRGTVATLRKGALALRVELERGALVPPFAERVHVQLTVDDWPADGEVKLSAVSADPAEVTLVVGGMGQASFELTALAQPVQLSFEARAGSATLTGNATLPVTMSGMYVAPRLRDGQLDVVSSGPRSVAFLSFYDERGRASGAVVPLQADERGFFRGVADVPEHRVTAITASAEPHEKGQSTTVWPFPGRRGAASAPLLAPALDGTAAALDRERRRVKIVRIATVTALTIAAVLELLLLLLMGRREGERVARLGADLAQDEVADAERDAGPGVSHSRGLEFQLDRVGRSSLLGHRTWIVAIAALVLLSFVAIAALVVY